jgi:hypothetical protein
MTAIDEERLNLAIRKFLKVVGVTSQREIEKAVREAAAAGRLAGSSVKASVVLELPELGVTHRVEDELEIGTG